MNEVEAERALVLQNKKELFVSFLGDNNAIKTTSPPINSVMYDLYHNGMVFRGFRLGMNLQDVLNHFGDIRLRDPIEGFEIFEHIIFTFAWESPDKIENFNKQGFFNYTSGWIYIDKNKYREFIGIQEIDISFINGLCNEINFSFDNSFDWRNIEEFTEAISMTNNFRGWNESNSKTARILKTDNAYILAWINTEKEIIEKNGLSQFTYGTSDEVFHELESERIENDLSWNNIEWGMSLQELKQVYPKAQLLSEPNIYTHNEQKFESWLCLRNFPLLDIFFEVDFITNSQNELTGIVLGIDDKKSLEDSFIKLSNFLGEKYGVPEAYRNGYSLKWNLSNVQVSLNYIPIKSSHSYFIKLSYWNE